MSWKWASSGNAVQLVGNGNFPPHITARAPWVIACRVRFGAIATAQNVFSARATSDASPLILCYFYAADNTLRLYVRDGQNNNQCVGDFLWTGIAVNTWYDIIAMRRDAAGNCRLRVNHVEVVNSSAINPPYFETEVAQDAWAFGGLYSYSGPGWGAAGELSNGSIMCDMGLWSPSDAAHCDSVAAAFEGGAKPSTITATGFNLRDAWDRDVNNKTSTGPTGSTLTTTGGTGTIDYDTTVPAGGGLVKKYAVPTTAADGTTRALFVWDDLTLNTMRIDNEVVIASGGYFKFADPGAVTGTKYPAVLVGFGASDAAAAFGGPCWATGVAE